MSTIRLIRLAAPVPLALFAGAVLAQFADKLSADTIAFAATEAGAASRIVAWLVAAQSAAWLLMSLPAGVWVDRWGPRRLMMVGGALIASGSAAAAAVQAIWGAGLGLAPFAFLASAGMVAVALSTIVILPSLLENAAEIPRANARIELGRAVLSLAASLLAGWAVARGLPQLALALCAIAGVAVLLSSSQLPDRRSAPRLRQSLWREIAEGATFVAGSTYLRPIALCAIAWNLAFFGFLAVMAPFAARLLELSPDRIGSAAAAYGIGLLAGALLAGPLIARLPTGVLLVFGPASSIVAALAVTMATPPTGLAALSFAFFLFGFGPIVWFIVQNSLRQLVTPPHLLGRVSATLTTAIYGMRPLGALLAGAVAERFGLPAAVWLPVALFAISTAAILLSGLPRLMELPSPLSPRAAE